MKTFHGHGELGAELGGGLGAAKAALGPCALQVCRGEEKRRAGMA